MRQKSISDSGTMGTTIKNVRTLGEGGRGLAVSGHTFQCVSVREKRAFKGHFVIIFLCYRLKNKEANKK